MPSPTVEWYYDASTSRTLRVVAHLPPAGFGGVLLLAIGVVVAFVATNPTVLLSGSALLVILLLIIGGPVSLAYLWPMLTDPKQRPSTSEFAGVDGFPFSRKSVGGAAVSGAIGILVLLAVNASGTVIYWLVVGCVFSPVLVAIATTHGQLKGGTLTINRTEVPLNRITKVRSIQLRGVVIVSLSYARRSGLFLPRLVVVPSAESEAVLSMVRSGISDDPEIEPPDRAVQAVVFATGALFLGVAVLAHLSIDEPGVRLYSSAIIGGIGAVFCVVGVRGI